jgi:hypothetical protein
MTAITTRLNPSNPTLESLEQQVDCYRRLAKLAQLQHVHVEQNRTDALLDVLQSRRAMLDEIQRLERSIGPAKARWSEYLGSISGSDRSRVEALMGEARDLLEQITTADRNDVLVLQQRKLNLGRQINQAKTARSVNRNYGTSAFGQQSQSKMDIQQ